MYELLNQQQDLVFFHLERSVKLKCENMDACTTLCFVPNGTLQNS